MPTWEGTKPELADCVPSPSRRQGERVCSFAPRHVELFPAKRGVNASGGGQLFDRSEFHYDEASDSYRCPAGETLVRRQLNRRDRVIVYSGQAKVCGGCVLKSGCTMAAQRTLKRHLHDAALERMQQRATPETMRLRRTIVEHPFATVPHWPQSTPSDDSAP